MNFSDGNLGGNTQSAAMLKSTEANSGIRHDSDFARIEELIKGNTFTREETTRLMEILNSRMDKEEEHKKSSNAQGDAQLVLRSPELLKTPSQGTYQFIERTVIDGYREKPDVPVGVSASPIDIARAYMAGRNTEEGQYNNNSISNSERPQQTNEFARKPLLLPSPSPKPSICWPGAVVHDRHSHGYTTPQNQRAKSRFHVFPATPYSRTMPSKSTTKLQADSGYASTSTPFQKSPTPLYGQGRLRGETVDTCGSVGPIRRIRNKFSSEVRPRGSIFRKEFPPKVPTTEALEGFLPSADKNLLRGETSEAARKAVELLDRIKPTPKQKEAELNLVTSRDATHLIDVENRTSSSSKFSSLGNFHSKGINEARDATAGISNSVPGADAIPVFSLKQNWNKTETSSQFSLPLSNGQNAKITTEAEASKNHGTKPSLASISTNRVDFRAASSDNGPSFTFPISASSGVFSEPPTPSIMPISSIPSYSFDSKKSGPSVVFSFPSTSSAANHDDSDLKFSFGSDKTTRLSFSSFGKDSICY